MLRIDERSAAAPAGYDAPLIACRNVSKVYRMGSQEVHALRNVSVEFRRGEMTAIMGPSGSGKSTMMNLIGALDVPAAARYDRGPATSRA